MCVFTYRPLVARSMFDGSGVRVSRVHVDHAPGDGIPSVGRALEEDVDSGESTIL